VSTNLLAQPPRGFNPDSIEKVRVHTAMLEKIKADSIQKYKTDSVNLIVKNAHFTIPMIDSTFTNLKLNMSYAEYSQANDYFQLFVQILVRIYLQEYKKESEVRHSSGKSDIYIGK
jgi:hypothetical protein